ncbi:GGDEF domain-containing protein [Neobacillus soli]|uniref:GGDEF domain-containing protein n=1 Tax=Neobacillus soli TaxID=220688 RepID=UPI000825A768|nr:GGDEF domain-containing protein [Neobacillus soli]
MKIVLVKLANILKTQARPADIAARFGGEEFVIFLPHTDVDEAKWMAQKFNQEVEQAEWKETGCLTVSVGAATFTVKDTEASILKNADQALYASKENGRNRATHFSELS